MGESSTSIPTPDKNCKDASTGCLVMSGNKMGGKKEEPTLFESQIKLQCFSLLPCCGKYSTASQPGFFFHSVAVKRSSTTATHLGIQNNWRRARKGTTFTTTQTTKTQFKKETDHVTYWKEEIRPAN